MRENEIKGIARGCICAGGRMRIIQEKEKRTQPIVAYKGRRKRSNKGVESVQRFECAL